MKKNNKNPFQMELENNKNPDLRSFIAKKKELKSLQFKSNIEWQLLQHLKLCPLKSCCCRDFKQHTHTQNQTFGNDNRLMKITADYFKYKKKIK